MKPLYIIILLLVFVTNQSAEYYDLSHPFVQAYLDDFLFFPIVFGLAEYIIRIQISKPVFNLPLSWGLLSAAVMSLLFEFLFPMINAKFTRDYFDFIAYFLGVGLFLILREKSDEYPD